MAGKSGVILQAHIDMVAQKTLESAHDFSRDPIRPQISGDRVCARQTMPDASSQLYAAVKTAFAAWLGCEPKTEVLHAGLVCGVLRQRLPDVEMVYFRLHHRRHPPRERVEIAALAECWGTLLAVLGKGI